MTVILDGKALAKKIRAELITKINDAKASHPFFRAPHLTVIIVGNNLASHTYVRLKRLACEQVGFISCVIHLDAHISHARLLDEIALLNADKEVDGILVQMPLPVHIDAHSVVVAIDPQKDVDGFHPINVGNLVLGMPQAIVPCTPRGILALLKEYQIPLAGRSVVIVGRSNIVSKPLAQLFLQHNATVTVCHSQTKHLDHHTVAADVVVVATGKAQMLSASMVKEGAVVVDVGINRLGEKLLGDVDFEGVFSKVAAISPVPGGVGPMTITMLLVNTWECALRRAS